jgi:hypothetical protein
MCEIREKELDRRLQLSKEKQFRLKRELFEENHRMHEMLAEKWSPVDWDDFVEEK